MAIQAALLVVARGAAAAGRAVVTGLRTTAQAAGRGLGSVARGAGGAAEDVAGGAARGAGGAARGARPTQPRTRPQRQPRTKEEASRMRREEQMERAKKQAEERKRKREERKQQREEEARAKKKSPEKLGIVTIILLFATAVAFDVLQIGGVPFIVMVFTMPIGFGWAWILSFFGIAVFWSWLDQLGRFLPQSMFSVLPRLAVYGGILSTELNPISTLSFGFTAGIGAFILLCVAEDRALSALQLLVKVVPLNPKFVMGLTSMMGAQTPPGMQDMADAIERAKEENKREKKKSWLRRAFGPSSTSPSNAGTPDEPPTAPPAQMQQERRSGPEAYQSSPEPAGYYWPIVVDGGYNPLVPEVRAKHLWVGKDPSQGGRMRTYVTLGGKPVQENIVKEVARRRGENAYPELKAAA